MWLAEYKGTRDLGLKGQTEEVGVGLDFHLATLWLHQNRYHFLSPQKTGNVEHLGILNY